MNFNHYSLSRDLSIYREDAQDSFWQIFGMLHLATNVKKNSEVKSPLGTDTKSRSFAIQRENRFNNLNNSYLIDNDL